MTYSLLGLDTQSGQRVEIPKTSRPQGLYIIGIPGTGKSGLIENLIIQDIKQGLGVGLLDPHGDLTQAVLAKMPENRVKDVIYIDITDYHYPFGINLFECSDLTNPIEVQKTVDQVMHIFEKLFGVSHETPLILEYLQNCTQTLIANPGFTMADIPLLLQDEQCRGKLIANVTDIDVQRFWKLHDQKKPADQINDISSTLRRVKQFLQPLSRSIVGQSTSTLDLQTIMDEGKILLVKLDARLDSITSLIGSMFIALTLNAAYGRQANKRRQFNLYADEFQRFATDDFATLLIEARKFGIGTTIAHQARYQPGMTDGIRATSLSAANLVVFKVNSKDANDLAGEFDITPDKAWEEETEQQKLDRIDLEVIDGIEPILSVTQTPFEHLVRYGHSVQAVNELIHTTLKPLANALEIAQGETEQADIWTQKVSTERVFIQTLDEREYVATRQQLLQGKHLIDRLLFESMQQSIPPQSALARLMEIAESLRGFIGLAPGAIWKENRKTIDNSYDTWGKGGRHTVPRVREATSGFWDEVSFDQRSREGVKVLAEALVTQSEVSQQIKEPFTQARLAFYTGKTEQEWEKEYLLALDGNHQAVAQDVACHFLILKKRKELAIFVTLDNCFENYLLGDGYDIAKIASGGFRYSEIVHRVFNPFNHFSNDLEQFPQRLKPGMTDGLVRIRESDFERFKGHNPLPCEGYRFKKEVTATFESILQRILDRCIYFLLKGTNAEVKNLVAGLRHECYETEGYVDRKTAAQVLLEFKKQVVQVITPMYNDAIFWFYPSKCTDLGDCKCMTDETICPYNLPCQCKTCRSFRAQAPRVGYERTTPDWPTHGVWMETKFPHAVDWLKQFIEQKYKEMKQVENEIDEAQEGLTQNLNQLVESKAIIDKYEESREFLPVAEAQCNRVTDFLTNLYALCIALANPDFRITVPSGQAQPRKRMQPHLITHPRQTIPHPQRSYADMLNEVASELTNLPNYTAQVRIAIDERRVEHTIRTLEPERGLMGTALQERIARIREQNIGDGYVLPRHEVEAEIQLRQAQCSQQPDDPPDAIYRRPPR